MPSFWVDYDNGNDADDGTDPVPQGGGVGPWATLDQPMENARVAGDIITVRRGMGQAAAGDLAPVSVGDIENPIVVKADYADTWGDDATAAQTATLTFGSKAVTFAAVGHGVVVGDWLYETTEDNERHSYEVAVVAGVDVTLFLPYKGNRAGAGRTMEIMPSSPVWNNADAANGVDFSDVPYWQVQGLEFHANAGGAVIDIDASVRLLFRDCTFDQIHAAWYVLYVSEVAFAGLIDKSRFQGGREGITCSRAGAGAHGAFNAMVRNCLLDGEDNANSTGMTMGYYDHPFFDSCELKNHALGDFANTGVWPSFGVQIRGRNNLLSSVTPISQNELNAWFEFQFSAHQGVPGATENFNSLGTVEGQPNYESDTGTVRVDGSLVSIEVTPSTELSSAWELSWLEVLKLEMYLTAEAHTVTVWVKTNDSAEWTADPTVAELWLQAEFLSHATNAHWETVKSTELIDFNGSTAWQPLSVTFTPSVAGDAVITLYYAKPKEVADNNIWFADPVPVLS